jgi:hypothetical protein
MHGSVKWFKQNLRQQYRQEHQDKKTAIRVNMTTGGKGCKPRPFSVSQDEFDNRWDLIFKKEKKAIDEVSKLIAKETLDETESKDE